MELIHPISLARGAAVIEYAFWNERPFSATIPDLVGIVAAYIGQGSEPGSLQKELSKRLGKRIGEDAAATFDLFDGKGLWERGASLHDISFTHDALAKLYPRINRISDAWEDNQSRALPEPDVY